MAEHWHRLGPFTAFDLETTGLSPVFDRIVEIGAVRIDLDGTVSRFSTLVNPGSVIPERITAINGISNEMVADAPKFTDAAYQFLDFMKGSKLVAHNARFDLSFLQESLARVGLPLIPGGVYDSIMIIRRAFPGLPGYSLQKLRESLKIEADFPGDPHRAAFDAELTMAIFSLAMKQLNRCSCSAPQEE